MIITPVSSSAKMVAYTATAATLATLVFTGHTFTAANATEIFTIAAHGFVTGDGPFQASTSSALPTGLLVSTDYWPIVIDANTFYLATSLANALAGTNLLITTNGTGTQTLTGTASTVRAASVMVPNKFYHFTCTSNCWIKQGTTPTAVPGVDGNIYVAAGAVIYLDGTVGPDLSVVRDSADGKAVLAGVKTY